MPHHSDIILFHSTDIVHICIVTIRIVIGTGHSVCITPIMVDIIHTGIDTDTMDITTITTMTHIIMITGLPEEAPTEVMAEHQEDRDITHIQAQQDVESKL